MVEKYVPFVPAWVGEILELDKLKRQSQYSGALCSGQRRRDWDEWKERYSRKLKYARLNGWVVGE